MLLLFKNLKALKPENRLTFKRFKRTRQIELLTPTELKTSPLQNTYRPYIQYKHLKNAHTRTHTKHILVSLSLSLLLFYTVTLIQTTLATTIIENLVLLAKANHVFKILLFSAVVIVVGGIFFLYYTC